MLRRMPPNRQRSGMLALALAALALLHGCAWLDERQREIIYRPSAGSLSQWQAISAGDEALWLQRSPAATAPAGANPAQSSDGPLRAMWVPQPQPNAPAVLYLHGTLRNVFQNRDKIAAIHQAGFSVLAVDYRGYGESPAMVPSEASIMEDAEVAWAEFIRRAPDPAQRVIFGHSMGSGVAVELTLRKQGSGAATDVSALVLEAPFTSMPDIARDHSWLGWLLHSLTTQHFRSIEKIGRIHTPLWILTGTADNTVPSGHSQRLFGAANEPKRLHSFEGGSHSALQREFPQPYQAAWAEVTQQLRTRSAALAPSSPR
jgi:alpha-beta hydrolase superfamily lysophospholipase